MARNLKGLAFEDTYFDEDEDFEMFEKLTRKPKFNKNNVAGEEIKKKRREKARLKEQREKEDLLYD